jgi:hypothetical protein
LDAPVAAQGQTRAVADMRVAAVRDWDSETASVAAARRRVEARLSYDLQVFAQRSLSAEKLRQLVAASGLSVGEVDKQAEALAVLRGARAKYCFTVGLPVPIQPEDVPEEVTAVLLAPSWLYEVLVEGSSATETPHAVRFARKLAEASGGVVVDQQTDQTWHRGQLRSVAPVQRGIIDLVQLHWYFRGGDSGGAAARAWLDLARQHLPEASPRRFGTFEPLPMKLDADGPEAFVRAVATEKSSVFFKARTPCIEGSLAGAADTWPVLSHSLSLHREPLAERGWREALQRLFVGFAEATGSFFACAEVQRGLKWSGRSVWHGGAAERTTYLAARGKWAGLPPYPVWWSWFGPTYVPFVAEHLPPDQVQAINDGLFHSRGPEPQDRGQLVAALGGTPSQTDVRRGLRGRLSRRNAASPPDAGRTWLPEELQPAIDNSDPSLYNPPLEPALTMPAELASPN